MGRKREVALWLVVFASVAIAAAPYPAVLTSPTNNTTMAVGNFSLAWADSFDPDSDFLFDFFDDVANWTVSNGYNSTQAVFLRDNSTYGMNWTLEDADGSAINSLLRIGFQLNISEYETFEFYLKSSTNLTYLILEFNDTHQNMSRWNLTESYCGALAVDEVCRYSINISNPDYTNGTMNLTNFTAIMFWTQEDWWGNSSENKSIFIDSMKFVDNATESRTYHVQVGNLPTNLTLEASTGGFNYSYATTSGSWYYWAINVTDAVSNVISKVWRLFSNTAPYMAEPLPNRSVYVNQTYTITLGDYFNDTDGDELNYSWVNVTNITISVNVATNIASLVPDNDWEGSREITFTANDSMDTVNSTFNLTVINLAPTQPVLLTPTNSSRQIGNVHNLTWISAFDPDTDTLLFGFDNTTGWISEYSENETQVEFYRQTLVSGDINGVGMNWTLQTGGDNPSLHYTFSQHINLTMYEYVTFYAKSTVNLSVWTLAFHSPYSGVGAGNYTSWALHSQPCGVLAAGEECYYKINTSTGEGSGVFNSSDVESVYFSTTTQGWNSIDGGRSIYLDYIRLIDIDNGEPTYYIYFGENASDLSVNGTTENTTYAVDTIDGTTYYWEVVAGDPGKNSTASGVFNFLENTKPDITALNISPSPAFTNDNLTCNYVYYDNQSDVPEAQGAVFIRWYNGTQNRTEYENQTVVGNASTNRDEAWHCNITLYDGYEWSAINTTSITIQNTPPVINLVEDDSSPASPTPPGSNATFNVTWYDIDIDSVSFYVCNSTSINSSGCLGQLFCNVANDTSSKSVCQYNASVTDPGVVEYWAMGCDNANCSTVTAMYKFGVAKEPYPVMLIGPVNTTNNTGNSPALQWASSYDPNSDLLVEDFDDFSDWSTSALGNLTLQSAYRRDNSTSALNWTLENDGRAPVEGIDTKRYEPYISKEYSGGKDVSDYEYFELYIKAGDKTISTIYLDLWDTSSNRKMWASNSTDCGVLEAGEECLFRVNISSTPIYSSGSFDSALLQYVVLRASEVSFGAGDIDSAENASLYVDYAKFVDLDARNVQYYAYIGNSTNQTLNRTTNNITHTTATTDGVTYYWKVQAFDEQYNASDSEIWNFLENTGPTLYTPIPDISFRKNFNYTIDLYDYFNDTDGDVMVFNWTGNTYVNITNISQATQSYNVTLFALANWSGAEEVIFFAYDDFEGINDTTSVDVTNLRPSAPALTSPANNARVKNNSYTLFWNASTDLDNDSITYYLFFTNGTLDYGLHRLNATNHTNYTVGTDRVNDGQNYTWAVIAGDGTDNSTGNSEWKFIENSIPVLTSVRILPSPANTVSNLTCNYTYSDGQGDSKNTTLIKWYNGTLEMTSLENQSAVSSINTTIWDVWNCTITAYDGYEWSLTYNASREIGDYYVPNLTFSPVRNTYNLGEEITLTLNITPAPLNATGFTISVVETGDNITLGGSDMLYTAAYTPNTTGALTFEYNYSDAQDDFNISETIYVSGSYNLTNVTLNRVYSNGGVAGNVSFVLLNANNDTIDKTVYCNSSNSTGNQIEYTSDTTADGAGTCTFSFDRTGFNNISISIADSTGNNASAFIEANIDWLTLTVVANKTTFEESETGGVNITLYNSTGNASGASIACNNTWQDEAGSNSTTTTTSNQYAYCTFNFTEPGPHVVNVTAIWGGMNLSESVAFDVYPYYNTTLTTDYTTVNLLEPFNISVSVTYPNGTALPALNGTHNISLAGVLFPLVYNETTESYKTEVNISSVGTYRAYFTWTNTSNNLSSYASQVILVTSNYTVEYSSGDQSQVEGDWENYTFSVTDIHGNPVPSVTTGSCSATTPANASNFTGVDGYFACVAYFGPPKIYTVTMSVNKDGNSGSGSTEVTVSSSSPDDDGGTTVIYGGGGTTTTTGGTTKPVKFDEYPEEIKIGAGKTKTISFKLKNSGNITSEAAKIMITNINSTWYGSSEKSIGPGETKSITVKFTIPKDAELMDYSISIKAYADVCGVKVNGTYSGTSYCERKSITLSVVDPSEDDGSGDGDGGDGSGDGEGGDGSGDGGGADESTTAAGAEAAIASAASKKEELESAIPSLEAINASTTELQTALTAGDAQLASANSSYDSGSYDNTKNYAGQALLKYNEGLQKAKALVDAYLGEEQSGASSKVVALAGKVPAEQEANYAQASGLIDEGDTFFANGEYAKAKTNYAEALAILAEITPVEVEPEPEPEPGERLNLLPLAIVAIIIGIIGTIAFLKRDVLAPYINDKIIPRFKGLTGKVKEQGLAETLKGAPDFFKSLPSKMRGLPETLANLPDMLMAIPEKLSALTVPITICKHAWPDSIRRMMENEVSITISLYNKGAKAISYLEIEDFLPSYFYLIPETITVINKRGKPQTKKVVNGTKLKWQFEGLAPGESLAIVYKFRVVPASDTLHIPASKLKVTIDKKTVRLKTKPFVIGVV